MHEHEVKIRPKIELNRPKKIHRQTIKQVKLSPTRQGILSGVAILLRGDIE